MTNIPERIVDVCEAGRLGKSDHEMILLTVNMQDGCEATRKEVLNWGRADWSSMRADLTSMDWSLTLRSKYADEKICPFENCEEQATPYLELVLSWK